MFLSKEFDEKLIAAFELYNKRLCESLPSNEELEHITFSDTFEKKMKKLIMAQKKSYYYLINTVGKRVAIIVLAIIISFTATTFGVKGIREAVIEFITETFERFTRITVQNEEPDIPQEILIKNAPQYIPEGYTLESEMDLGGIYQINYNNKENNPIVFGQEIYYKNIFRINTENVDYEKILINSFEGVFYNKKGINTVIFADETYLYKIYGQVSKEEIIKIAESIKIK